MHKLDDPKGETLIFLRCALEEHTHIEQLRKFLASGKYGGKSFDAIHAGLYALKEVYTTDVRQVRDRGQLLFCFPGTTVLQQPGGAA